MRQCPSPISVRPGEQLEAERTYSSASIFAARETWSLGAAFGVRTHANAKWEARLTDDQRDHGGAISSSSLKTLDQLLDFPYLDVLLSLVLLRGTHVDLTSLLLGKLP